ncbi:MAG: CHAT domain-containing protein [Bacteroidia bacterium]|nr:CHAT domain-containing protein [Bacteroidia bacterium]
MKWKDIITTLFLISGLPVLIWAQDKGLQAVAEIPQGLEEIYKERNYKETFSKLKQEIELAESRGESSKSLELLRMDYALQCGFLDLAKLAMNSLRKMELGFTEKLRFLWLQLEWERINGDVNGLSDVPLIEVLPDSGQVVLSEEDRFFLGMIKSSWKRGRGKIQDELTGLQEIEAIARKGEVSPFLLNRFWISLASSGSGAYPDDSIYAFHTRASNVLNGACHPRHLARFYGAEKQAFFHWNTGDYTAVLDTMKLCEGELNRLGLADHPFWPMIWKHQSASYNRLGDTERNITLAKRAVVKMEQLFPQGHKNLDVYYNGLANAYGASDLMNMDYQRLALVYYQKALENRTRFLGEENEGVVLFLFNIGSTYFLLEEIEKGFEEFNKAIKLGEKVFGEDHLTMARMYLGMSEYYMFMGDFKSMEKLTRKGLAAYKKKTASNHPVRITAHVAMAMCFNFQGEHDSTRIYIEEAFRGYFPQFRLDEIEKLASEKYFKMYDHQSISNLFGVLGDYCLATNQLELARRTFKTSLEWNNQYAIRSSYLEAGWGRNSIFEDHYAALLEINYRLFQQTGDQKYNEEAFAYADAGKTNNLRFQLQTERALDFARVPKEAIEKEKELFEDYIQMERQLLSYDPNDIDPEILVDYEGKKQAYLNWQESIEKKYPAYFELKYDKSLQYPEIIRQKLNSPHTLLLEFSFTNYGYLSKIAFDNEKTIHILDSLDAGLKKDINRFIEMLSEVDYAENNSYSKQFFQSFTELSHRLYQNLIAGVLDSFENKSYDKLLIIPDQQLNKLPFDVLLYERADTSILDYQHLRYLINKYQIRSEYSASLIPARNTPQLRTRYPYLGMAPVFASSYRKKLPAEVDTTAIVNRLKYNQEEVERAYSLLGGRAFKGNDAVENKVKQYIDDASILHFATHTLLNDSLPLYTSLVLQEEESGKEDGFLHAYEIYSRKLNAQLAVLSACETGLGRWQDGEGMMSMARAFKYAGCPNIVMSLWQADDQSTSEIVSNFFSYIKEGKDKDDALRQAKLDFLAKGGGKNFPHYWATFVLVGDDKAVDLINAGSGGNFAMLLGRFSAILLLGLILVVIYVRRLRKKRGDVG